MEKKEDYVTFGKNVNGYKVWYECPENSLENEQIKLEIKEILLKELKTRLME